MTPDMPGKVLTENDVVLAVHRYLCADKRFEEIRSCNTKEKGYDVVACYRNSDRRLIIEAKGATSAREGSSRFEKGFTPNQIRSHVARAFYAAAATLQHEKGNAHSGIAFPDTVNHRKFVDAIAQPLKTLGIKVFWVQNNGGVSDE